MMKTYMVIKCYKIDSDSRSYFEVASVVNDQLGSFHRMNDNDRRELAAKLGETVNANISYSREKSSCTLIELAVSSGRLDRLLFSMEPKEVTLTYSGLKPFTAKLPKMVVKVVGNSIYLYFVERKGRKELLYNAFLPNVYISGELCQGSSDMLRDVKQSIDVNSVMNRIHNELFANTFSHSNTMVDDKKLTLAQMRDALLDGSYTKFKGFYKKVSEL